MFIASAAGTQFNSYWTIHPAIYWRLITPVHEHILPRGCIFTFAYEDNWGVFIVLISSETSECSWLSCPCPHWLTSLQFLLPYYLFEHVWFTTSFKSVLVWTHGLHLDHFRHSALMKVIYTDGRMIYYTDSLLVWLTYCQGSFIMRLHLVCILSYPLTFIWL